MNSKRVFELSRLAALALLLAAAPGTAGTRYVAPPGVGNHVSPYENWHDAATNIQTAIDAAAAGERIYVTNAVYALPTVVKVTKGVTLSGYGGRPILNGRGTVQCLIVSNANATVSGFVISNGYQALTKGGVAMWAGTVDDCIITQCGNFRGSVWGGGVSMAGSAQLINSLITGNTTSNGGGAGALVTGNAVIRNSTLSRNVCWKELNVSYGGAGAYIRDSAALVNCSIVSNVCYTYAGGVYMAVGQPRLENCLILGNSNVVNSGIGGGAAFMSTSMTGLVRNCTVVNNYSYNYGGGLYARYTTPSLVENTISYSNRSPWQPLGAVDYKHGTTGNSVFTNSCLGYADTLGAGSSGTISDNPRFLNMGAGDFRLQKDSACVNTGTNRLWMYTALDLGGHRRIAEGIVDRGAYEYEPPGTSITIR